MSSLRSTLTELAQTFAANVLEAIRQMSLDEILAEAQLGGRGGPRTRAALATVAAQAGGARGRGAGAGGGRRGGGRLGRRSADDIAQIVEQIVDVLERHPEGLRAEQIRAELGLEAKELPRPLAEALSSKRVTKQGQKRATTYFVRGAASKGSGGAARGKPTGKKRGRPAKKRAAEAQAPTNGAASS